VIKVKITLHESTAREAEAAGLLQPDTLDRILREEIRRRNEQSLAPDMRLITGPLFSEAPASISTSERWQQPKPETFSHLLRPHTLCSHHGGCTEWDLADRRCVNSTSLRAQ
jgi:hypothetical protein